MPSFKKAFEEFHMWSLESIPMRYWSYRDIRLYRQKVTPVKLREPRNVAIRKNEVIKSIFLVYSHLELPKVTIFPGIRSKFITTQIDLLLNLLLEYKKCDSNNKDKLLSDCLQDNHPMPTKFALVYLINIENPEILDTIILTKGGVDFITAYAEYIDVSSTEFWIGVYLAILTLLHMRYKVMVNDNNEFIMSR